MKLQLINNNEFEFGSELIINNALESETELININVFALEKQRTTYLCQRFVPGPDKLLFECKNLSHHCGRDGIFLHGVGGNHVCVAHHQIVEPKPFVARHFPTLLVHDPAGEVSWELFAWLAVNFFLPRGLHVLQVDQPVCFHVAQDMPVEAMFCFQRLDSGRHVLERHSFVDDFF